MMAYVRADRLVAVLMLLQTRGRVTAGEVAAELEISERTARRDLDALAMAGLPVYSQPGRNGGWQLLGGARTDLSGLNAAEARALFLVAGPSPASPELKAALRKLVRALPEPFRADAQAASTAVVVDPNEWGRVKPTRPAPRHLDVLQRVVIEGEQVELGYVARDRAESTRIVHPLGLAAKGSIWYLVAGTEAGLRTFRVDRVTAVEGTGDAVVRPDGFELGEAWRLIREEVDQLRSPIQVRLAAVPGIVGILRMVFDTKVRVGGTRPDGRIDVEIAGAHIDALAGQIGGFGGAVEVLEPPELRDELARIGAELCECYGVQAGSRP
jgi:predicted DNA-binding transcriptional regulator YafY